VGRALMELGRDDLARVVVAIEVTVMKSLREDGARATGDEIQQRFDICECLIRLLRGDLGWGLQRVIDHLPHYLRCELDGQRWEPDRRTIWMPTDGA